MDDSSHGGRGGPWSIAHGVWGVAWSFLIRRTQLIVACPGWLLLPVANRRKPAQSQFSLGETRVKTHNPTPNGQPKTTLRIRNFVHDKGQAEGTEPLRENLSLTSGLWAQTADTRPFLFPYRPPPPGFGKSEHVTKNDEKNDS